MQKLVPASKPEPYAIPSQSLVMCDTSQTDWIIVAFINTPDGAANTGRPVLDELINWVAVVDQMTEN